MDLKTCVYGHLYRKKLSLTNRGKIAFKIQAVCPEELKGHLEFTPDMGFAQPGGDFELGLKLRPSERLLEQCKPYVLEEFNVIAVPVRVYVPKQVTDGAMSLLIAISSVRVLVGDSCIFHSSGPAYTIRHRPLTKQPRLWAMLRDRKPDTTSPAAQLLAAPSEVWVCGPPLLHRGPAI